MFTIFHGHFVFILGDYVNKNEGTSVVPYFAGVCVFFKLHFNNYDE